MTAFNSQVGRLPAHDRRARADARRSRSSSIARRRSARSCRGTTGRCTASSGPRRASTRAAGSTRSSKKQDDDPDARGRAAVGPGRAPRRSPRRATASRARVTEETKPTTQIAPLLYDLTSLQREANGRFGFSRADDALQLAQALYEKHKVLTYPRTDSRALPEDYHRHRARRRSEVAGREIRRPTRTFARARVIKEKWVRPNQRIFDNAKVSDHFAIIPTLATPKHLNEAEQKLYDMVARRFLAVFFPPAEFLVTTRITRVARASRSSPKARCWSSPAGSRSTARRRRTDEPTLVAVEAGEKVATEKVDVVKLARSRRRASTKRRCSPRWKAPAS